MDQNLPIVTKKLLNMMKVVFYILRKSINKKKLLLDLNLLIKRGKFVASKTLTNLLSHHHANHNVSATFEDEYEFSSCTNTPFNRKDKHHGQRPNVDSLNNMWEMLVLSSNPDSRVDFTGCRTPGTTTRTLRITDSPYPVQNEGGDVHVDAAAEAFIRRFYSQLREQTS